MYLEETVRLYQQFLAGQPVYLSKGIPVGLVGGLPRILPGSLRRCIRRGDPIAIKATFSILSVYRIMDIPGVLKLNTITDPFKGQTSTFPS